MPVDVDAFPGEPSCRLSSFGFSGTIAHGAYVRAAGPRLMSSAPASSAFRRASPVARDREDPPAESRTVMPRDLFFATIAEHAVAGAAIFPGVGYVEVAAAGAAVEALLRVTFLRPRALTGGFELRFVPGNRAEKPPRREPRRLRRPATPRRESTRRDRRPPYGALLRFFERKTVEVPLRRSAELAALASPTRPAPRPRPASVAVEARPGRSLARTVVSIATSLLGTVVPRDAPLMSAGLDSLRAADLARSVGAAVSTEVPSTLVFDYPSASAIATAFAAAPDRAEKAIVSASATPPRAPAAPRPARRRLRPRGAAFVLPGGASDARALRAVVARAACCVAVAPPSRGAPAYGALVAAAAVDGAFGLAAEARRWTGSRRARSPRAPRPSRTTRPGRAAARPWASSSAATASSRPTRGPARLRVALAATSRALSVASGRCSHALGLVGPCLAVATACSSALVAAHVAAALAGAAAVVAVGGVAAGVTASFAAAGMLSPRGRCHTFDGRADGYARGEGALGTVLAAYADGVAVAASAVQHDGASASLTAPNGSSQRRLIAAVAPSDDGALLEAHGTGTALGDPVEVAAAAAALAGVAFESAKANLGHLEAVAAFSGLAALVVAGCLADAAPNAALRRLNAHLSPTLRAR
ncbi:hypothetical protein JL720_15276 [Aureococcus anophagefferens]|nr:hypothetical protein JL720_15276 [Aureococcus anophagefferens]